MNDKDQAAKDLLLAAKEAAVMLARIARVQNISPSGPGFDRLMAAIERYEAANAR